MGKIFLLLGKSSCGKDTLFRMLMEDQELSLKTIVSYTTRPMRAGETNGTEYYFCDEEKLGLLQKEGKVIELRAYDTIE
ncbi:MAG: guanylate kinase, partial [Clostridiales bacterium]|nr:guanylate kinase [Clostridiales bacterium]